MARAKLHTEHGLTLVKVGRREIIAHRITELRKVSAARWDGKANGCRFEIFGGKEAGGTARDWFVMWEPLGGGFMPCNSLVDAVQLIENA